ncbi:MAG: VWA domain-containing protein [Acidobacteriota bacterium]|nr:VWA domain-containing protein [Acidobacteriota bacterium]
MLLQNLSLALITVFAAVFVFVPGTARFQRAGAAEITSTASTVGAREQQPPQPSSSPSPSPSPTVAPEQRDTQEPVRVFTEEVRLPVVAVDEFGHYDPTVVIDDILVLEDGNPQQVKSVRHVPANVLLVLDTGGEMTGLGGMSKRTNLTRQVASALVRSLHQGDWVSVMQFSNKVELLQPWTTDRDVTQKVLKTKVSSGKRDVFSDAILAAAKQVQDRPEGSRHVVLITDGVDTAGAKADRARAVKQLMAARATVHIISYTEYVRQKNENHKSDVTIGPRPVSQDPITATDPTLPPGTTRQPSYGVSIRFDPAMRRMRKAYEADVKKGEQVLTSLAEETGGTIFLPKTADEMVSEADKVAREIGSEYVVTYRPTRPLATAGPNEYRKIEVHSRRVGLSLRSRRGYVVPGQDE